jgi:hypothetical protein
MSFVYAGIAVGTTALTAQQGDAAQRRAGNAASRAKRAEQARTARISRGREDINRIFGEQFTSDFYSGIEKDYGDWAMPQLNRQAAAGSAIRLRTSWGSRDWS